MVSTQPELPLLLPVATAVSGVGFEPGSRIALPSLLVTPGPELAAAIGVLVFADLTPAGHVEVAAACQRLARWVVWNALEAHARTSQAYSGRAQGDERSISQRRADGLVELCAGNLDSVSAGDLEYQAPRTSTGWSTYRPTPTHDSSTAPDRPTPDESGQPGRAVARRVLSEAALKRLRSTLKRRCMINLHMGADVALGLSDNPVYLDGYGWTPAPIGRRALSHNADMRRIIDDPITGLTLHISAKTYTPSPAMALAARMRDQVCTFPTCDTRATDCQLDHTSPHPHGRNGPSKPGDRHQTSIDGLGTLCDTDHRLKTLGGWHITHTPNGWEWQSPHGKIYTTHTVTYTPQTLTDLTIAEDTRTELADLVATEHDNAAYAQTAARRAAVSAVLLAAHPAPF